MKKNNWNENNQINENNSPLCQVLVIFSNFEKDLSDNMFDESFVWWYHGKLVFQLQEIFEMYKSALCCFLDNETQSTCRDWYMGETWSISLRDQIDYEEKFKVNKAVNHVKKKDTWEFFSKNLVLIVMIIVWFVVNAIKNVFSIFNVIFFSFFYLVVLFQKFQVV